MSPAVDSAALEAAAAIAEEALVCHREALILLAEGWKSETGSAIAEFMDRQCLCATDVVDALRRGAAGEARTDVWFDSGGDRGSDATARLPDPVPRSPDAAGPPAGPVTPTAPPTIPEPVPPWQAPPSPWSTAPPADAPWATGPLAGVPAAPASPAFPDLGGTLVGLVAEIAQALGSYADVAPGVELSPDPGSDALAGQDEHVAQPVSADDAPPPSVTGPPSPLPAPVPTSPVPPEAVAPAPATPDPAKPATTELLAAERPPEPVAAVDPATPPDASPAQPAPMPEVAAGAQQAVPSAAVPAEKTPCEIAADELPKVGE